MNRKIRNIALGAAAGVAAIAGAFNLHSNYKRHTSAEGALEALTRAGYSERKITGAHDCGSLLTGYAFTGKDRDGKDAEGHVCIPPAQPAVVTPKR